MRRLLGMGWKLWFSVQCTPKQFVSSFLGQYAWKTLVARFVWTDADLLREPLRPPYRRRFRSSVDFAARRSCPHLFREWKSQVAKYKRFSCVSAEETRHRFIQTSASLFFHEHRFVQTSKIVFTQIWLDFRFHRPNIAPVRILSHFRHRNPAPDRGIEYRNKSSKSTKSSFIIMSDIMPEIMVVEFERLPRRAYISGYDNRLGSRTEFIIAIFQA